MGAVFPQGIAQFTRKRNLIDDVNASDVNNLQDEVTAIESVLGTDINTTVNDAKQYPTLAQRLSDLEDGKNIYAAYSWSKNAFQLKRSGPYPPNLDNYGHVDYERWKTTAGDAISYHFIPLRKPTRTIYDPFNMYYDAGWGSGFVIPKDGFWLIQGHATVNLLNDVDSNKAANMGVFGAAVFVEGTKKDTHIQFQGHDTKVNMPVGNWYNLDLDPVLFRYINAGQFVSLRAFHTSELQYQTISRSSMSLVRLRS